MRVQSSDKILVKLFKQIKQSNQQIQKRIFQRRCIIEQSTNQLSELCKKLDNLCITPTESPQFSLSQSPLSHFQIIHLNSITFIQIMQVTNNLLTKFRYIFKLFIMMNIDKRRLSDQILKLEEVLDKKGTITGVVGNRWNQVDGKNINLIQDTNVCQLADIMKNWFSGIQGQVIGEVLAMFFNDFRVALLCRKTMIMEELHELKQSANINDFIRILTSIREQCEYSYNQKLKSSLKLLYECFKCSIKASSSVNTSRTTSTTTLNLQKSNSISHQNPSPTPSSSLYQNIHNILDSELYLPSGMFPKTKIGDNNVHNADEDIGDQENQDSPVENNKRIKQKMINNGEPQKLDTWNKNQKRNPSVIIRKLLAIRNQSTKKFKLLDLHECQKKYVKNTLKSMANIQLYDNNIILTKHIPQPQKIPTLQPHSFKSIAFDSQRKQKERTNSGCIKQQNFQINNFIK